MFKPVVVHRALSPNGDNINDYLRIEGLEQYTENKVMILDASGQLLWEGKQYDHSKVVFGGKDKKGNLLKTGTYYYLIEANKGATKHQIRGYFVVRY